MMGFASLLASRANASNSRADAADFTDRFIGIVEAVRGRNVDEALIDGEAVVFRDDGRSDFHALMTPDGGAEASLVAFDLLRLDGDDLRERRIEVRREALARFVAACGWARCFARTTPLSLTTHDCRDTIFAAGMG
jgi:bifunctional non-homologous end joining protein LigD